MPLLHKRLEGTSGVIVVPEKGLLIGKMAHWTLTRKADTGADADVFDLHATLLQIHEHLFHDPDYQHDVIVTLGKGRAAKSHRIIQLPNQRTALQGRSLIMERVLPHAIED